MVTLVHVSHDLVLGTPRDDQTAVLLESEAKLSVCRKQAVRLRVEGPNNAVRAGPSCGNILFPSGQNLALK
jgi:hypothetical protein